MSIPTRKLGGFQVNSIGFGAMGLSVGYGDAGSIEERLEVCKQLLYLHALILTFFYLVPRRCLRTWEHVLGHL